MIGRANEKLCLVLELRDFIEIVNKKYLSTSHKKLSKNTQGSPYIK